MHKVKAPLKVRLIKAVDENSPYLNQVGMVESIDRSPHGGYAVWIRFPTDLDLAAYGHVLRSGYMAFTNDDEDQVEILEGNPHTSYYGEWTDEMTEMWLSQ